MDKYNELKQLLLSVEEDVFKFYVKNNNVAGVRVRKGLEEVKQLAQEIRLDVTKTKKKK